MGSGLWTSSQLDWMRERRFDVVFKCFSWWMSAPNPPEFLDTLDRRKDRAKKPLSIKAGNDAQASAKLNPKRPLKFWQPSDGEPSSKTARRKQTKKDKSVSAFEASLARAILAKHQTGSLTLVILNTVKAAQALYR